MRANTVPILFQSIEECSVRIHAPSGLACTERGEDICNSAFCPCAVLGGRRAQTCALLVAESKLIMEGSATKVCHAAHDEQPVPRSMDMKPACCINPEGSVQPRTFVQHMMSTAKKCAHKVSALQKLTHKQESFSSVLLQRLDRHVVRTRIDQ